MNRMVFGIGLAAMVFFVAIGCEPEATTVPPDVCCPCYPIDPDAPDASKPQPAPPVRGSTGDDVAATLKAD